MLARHGDNAEAAKYLKAATELKPTANADEGVARAWLSLGMVEESQDPQQALAAYAEAAKLIPKSPEPHLSAAILLERQQKYDDAIREYRPRLRWIRRLLSRLPAWPTSIPSRRSCRKPKRNSDGC